MAIHGTDAKAVGVIHKLHVDKSGNVYANITLNASGKALLRQNTELRHGATTKDV
jgi:hypothetical protein